MWHRILRTLLRTSWWIIVRTHRYCRCIIYQRVNATDAYVLYKVGLHDDDDDGLRKWSKFIAPRPGRGYDNKSRRNAISPPILIQSIFLLRWFVPNYVFQRIRRWTRSRSEPRILWKYTASQCRGYCIIFIQTIIRGIRTVPRGSQGRLEDLSGEPRGV